MSAEAGSIRLVIVLSIMKGRQNNVRELDEERLLFCQEVTAIRRETWGSPEDSKGEHAQKTGSVFRSGGVEAIRSHSSLRTFMQEMYILKPSKVCETVDTGLSYCIVIGGRIFPRFYGE